MSEERTPPKVDDPKAQPWQRVHLWQIQSVRDLMMIGTFVGLIYLGYILSVITVPLLVALGLAYIVDPLVGWLTQRLPWLGRRGAVLSIMGILGLVVALALIITVPMVVKQTNQLMKNSDKYVEQARHFVADKNLPPWVQEGLGTLADFLPKRQTSVIEAVAKIGDEAVGSIQGKQPAKAQEVTLSPVPPKPEATTPDPAPVAVTPPLAVPALDESKVRELIRDELAKQNRNALPEGESGSATVAESPTAGTSPVSGGTLATVASGSAQVLAFLGNLIGGAAQLGIFFFIVVFCFYFFSAAFPGVKTSCSSLIPVGKRDRTQDLICKMDRAISGFVRGRLTICCVMGVIYAAGWTICGVPHAVLLGLAIGVCGLVPYLSAIGLPIAWALLVVSLTGETDRSGFYFTDEGAGAAISWWKVLLFPTLVNVIAQVIEDYVLNPMIQGKATNLHPAAILLACIAGGSLAGLYGLILAIPVTACLKILFDDVFFPRLKQWLAGRKEDPLPL